LGGATVEIEFSDARLCAIFNSIDRLSERYGKSVAQSIAVRMGVLAAAPALSHVPQKPPIGLKADGNTFTVELAGDRRLRFEPATPRARRRPSPDDVSHVTILGVEP
jgi:hypothetical protein